MGFLPDLSDTGTEDSPHGQGLRRLGIPDGVLTRGSWGSDILDELTPGEDDTVLYKNRYSGFYRTDLDEILQRSGIKYLIVTGCTTSICVESTIRDAFYRDYHCVVLADCTAEPMGAGLDRSNHDATIMLVERIFGSVSTSTDFVRALQPVDAIAR